MSDNGNIKPSAINTETEKLTENTSPDPIGETIKEPAKITVKEVVIEKPTRPAAKKPLAKKAPVKKPAPKTTKTTNELKKAQVKKPEQKPAINDDTKAQGSPVIKQTGKPAVKKPVKPRAKKPPVPKPPAKMGRPRKEITNEGFEKLCGLQCTQVEICDFFNVCEDTLNSWCKRNYSDEKGKPLTFSETFKRYAVNGKLSVRRWQFKHMEKSAVMAIYLGKVLLGQREDAEEIRGAAASGPPLIINYNYGSPSAEQSEESIGDSE